jgi:pyruvate formate lyase activating enzyme
MTEQLIAFRKTSLVDYPGKVAAVIFFPGCNLRCPWCQNRDLVIPDIAVPGTQKAVTGTTAPGDTTLIDALAHIEKRRNVLGGVVLSGGEPTLYRDLSELIRKIGKLGLPVKLDTNGTKPAVLEKLFLNSETRPSYIAMDLKIAPLRYAELLPGKELSPLVAENTKQDSQAAADSLAFALQKSACLIRGSGIPHEFRSLALPARYFGTADIKALTPLAGNSPWVIRPFVPGNCLDGQWDEFEASSITEIEALEQVRLSLTNEAISK